MGKASLLILLIIIVLALNIVFLSAYYNQMSDIPASDSVVFKELDEEQAFEQLQAGKLDYYLWSLKPEQAKEIESDPDIKLYFANSMPMALSLNAAPAKEGLNPFSIREVRFALNYLIDREKIIDKVYQGYAEPAVLTVPNNHPTYKLMKDVLDKYDFKHDKKKAISMIDKAMTKAGAEKIDGVWTYEGEVLTINIPSPNKYKEIVDALELVGEDIEEAGFDVKISYYNQEETLKESAVYSTDPTEQKWHMRYSGWIYYSTTKYEDLAFMGTYVPNDDWWKWENKKIDEIKEKVGFASSESEWIELNEQLIDLYFKDSVTMWLVNRQNIYAAQKDVKGLIDDKFIGLRSYINLRQAYVEGQERLTIGEGYLIQEDSSWNPVVVGGISMMDVRNTIHDSATASDPVTLEEEPFRWKYSINRIGQAVPSDAFVWDVEKKQWAYIGLTERAQAKVTYDLSDYIGSKWHHGEKISWADILFFVSSTWDRNYDEEKQEISSDRWQDLFDNIAGLRIVDDKLEVYLKKSDFRDDRILGFAAMFQRAAPWEIYAASDKLVFGDNGFQYGEYYGEEELEKLNLADKEHTDQILRILDKMKYSEVVSQTKVGKTKYLDENEFKRRKQVLHNWFDEHNHLIISDGPFYVDKYKGAIYMKAFKQYYNPILD